MPVPSKGNVRTPSSSQEERSCEEPACLGVPVWVLEEELLLSSLYSVMCFGSSSS